MLGFLIGLAVIVLVIGVPIAALVMWARARAELKRLGERIERLEAAWPGAPLPDEPPAAPLIVPYPAAASAPPAPPPPVPAPEVPVASAPSPSPIRSATNLEQLIGGVWLQNIGSVLLLVGVFLMILWGYTSHRVGPEVLLVSGVLLGLALMWRGDRIARHVAPFGHALFGVGLGVVYLTLYLGHVRLGVLPTWATFVLLVVVAFSSVLAGLHYRVQSIATLGVLGAFLPFLLSAWLPLRGLWMSPGGLIAYIAIVNAFVLVMAVRAGWSGLDVMGILLGTLAWIWSFHDATWGWGIQIALWGLFTALGFAPLPRLVGVEGRVRPMDLVAITLAPVCLIATSWPFLVATGRSPIAMLLAALAAVQLAAALWVDTRRPERDLWRPLTAAAIVLLAAALERALGTQRTAVAWCLEGLVLLALGLTPRGGGWLRLWGSLVVAVGVVWHLSIAWSGNWALTDVPGLYPAGLRGLACIAALLAGGLILSRRRSVLSEGERWTPDGWTAVGHLLLVVWIGQEGGHLATYLTYGRGGFPPPVGISAAMREGDLKRAIWGAAWMTQALVLAWSIPRRGGTFLRLCVSAIGVLAFVVVNLWFDGWGRDLLPILNAPSLLALGAALLAILVASRLARQRDPANETTRWIPEVWVIGAAIALMMWSSREAGHLAQAAIPSHGGQPGDRLIQERTAAAAITSGAWLLQATALLIIGWMRRSPFLRWCGLALFGITAFKFALVDLEMVELFWRFATAIALGAAMLAISYYYRRRSLTAREAESEESELGERKAGDG